MIEFGELEGAVLPNPGDVTLCLWESTGKLFFYQVTLQDPAYELKRSGFNLVNSWDSLDRGQAMLIQGDLSVFYHNFKPYKMRKGTLDCFRTKNIQGVYNFIQERVDSEGELYNFVIYQDDSGEYLSSVGTDRERVLYTKAVPYCVAIDLMKIEVTTDYYSAIIKCQQRIKHYA
jgi:hypothetical protein